MLVEGVCISMPALMDSLMGMLARKLQEKPHVKVTTHVSPLCSVILSDPVRIQQILFNFISNALKFTTDGSIAIRVQKLKQAVRISVSDTGRGIPEADQLLLFQPFHQVSPSDQSRFDGVGLGLYLVKLLGDLLDGRVGLESSLGIGSRFYLDLPLAVIPIEFQTTVVDSDEDMETAMLTSVSMPLEACKVQEQRDSLLL